MSTRRPELALDAGTADRPARPKLKRSLGLSKATVLVMGTGIIHPTSAMWPPTPSCATRASRSSRSPDSSSGAGAAVRVACPARSGRATRSTDSGGESHEHTGYAHSLHSPPRCFVSSAARTVHEPSCAPLRVVVAVPHARLRDALATALESTGTIAVVARAGDVGAAIRLTRSARPCALLLGISMLDGDVVRELQAVVQRSTASPSWSPGTIARPPMRRRSSRPVPPPTLRCTGMPMDSHASSATQRAPNRVALPRSAAWARPPSRRVVRDSTVDDRDVPPYTRRSVSRSRLDEPRLRRLLEVGRLSPRS